MLFGSDVKKQFFQKRIKGRGYCDVGTSVISEFYTPLVPKGHDFLQTIGRLAQERQALSLIHILTGITLSLVQSTVSFLIRTARNSLPPLRLMKTEIQML